MDRRWQKEGRGKYETLESSASLISRLPPLEPDSSINLASSADVYAVYSNLHSKGREVEIKSHDGCFWFLLASSSLTQKLEKSDPDPYEASSQMDIVVPVSSKKGFTIGTMQRLLQALVGGEERPRDILLAPVDDDGSVSLLRVHKGLVAPPSAAAKS